MRTFSVPGNNFVDLKHILTQLSNKSGVRHNERNTNLLTNIVEQINSEDLIVGQLAKKNPSYMTIKVSITVRHVTLS
jgi:hypothetical protein